MTGKTILVVDDEPLARRRLVRMLEPYGWIDRVEVAANIEDAWAILRDGKIHILLLDIQMPGGTGFDLLDRLRNQPPAVVFVTAYNDHALQAFRQNALDYLTKPVDERLFNTAMIKARDASNNTALADRVRELEAALAALRGQGSGDGRRLGQEDGIWVKTRAGHNRVPVSDILKVSAERDYVLIHARQGCYLHAEGIGEFEGRLPFPQFLRIHRSTIIRVDAVTHIRSGKTGSLHLALGDGEEVRVGRKYAREARAIIQHGAPAHLL